MRKHYVYSLPKKITNDMEFHELKPIYKQIIDTIGERVLTCQWKEGERVPSVRDLAAELGVNPNTVMRAYEYLQRYDVLQNSRGIGNFVCKNARAKIMEMRKTDFIENQLPAIFKQIDILEIPWQQIDELYKNRNNK